jgi:predicted AAA+ superfamily ATPase
MNINRDKYLNDLIDRMHNGMVKVVTGIRRCGKSYLIFTIFKNYLSEQGIGEQESSKDHCFRGIYLQIKRKR